MDYQRELRNKIAQAERQCDAAYTEVLRNPSYENISQLNNARMNLETAKSRLENYGKNMDYIPERVLPKMQ